MYPVSEAFLHAVQVLGSGLAVKGFAENIGIETMELVRRQMADRMGRVAVGAFGMVMDTN